jgi:hypothetical protein
MEDAVVETLICPSRNPTGTPAPLSYIVNAGGTDVYRRPQPPTNTPQPLDYRENGLFFDDFGWRLPPAFMSIPKPPTSDLAYVSKHDGVSMTLLLSENLDAVDWIKLYLTPAEANSGLLIHRRYQVNNTNTPLPSWWQSMIWTIPYMPRWSGADVPATANWGMTGSIKPGPILNKEPPIAVGPTTPPEKMDFYLGRPSSSHPGGFIVTMCDASARFMSEDIEYRVYCLLLSPDSQGAKRPHDGATYVRPSVPPYYYPQGWLATPTSLRPLTAPDLEP